MRAFPAVPVFLCLAMAQAGSQTIGENETQEKATPIFRMPRPRKIDPEDQFAKTVEAFERNGFVVLVDNRQVDRLDAKIPLKPETMVTFLKLVPLVGG